MKRNPANPILTREDIPSTRSDLEDVSSVFNPGAVRFRGRTFLLLRVQTRARRTVLMVAESEDGVRFRVRPDVVRINGLEEAGETIYHVYDPRLTPMEDAIYVTFAADTDSGCRIGMARTTDFDRFDLISMDRSEEKRNGALFPEKINGRYMRLERPNRITPEGGASTGSEIVLAESPDMVHWEITESVMSGRNHYWDELIGSGPPPVKTAKGWLHLYHGVARHLVSSHIYQAGAALLDLGQPSSVLARSDANILEPREMYEMVGQVPNVVFPSGWVVDRFDKSGFAEPDSRVWIYYGCADTCVGLALSTVGELLEACETVS